MRLALWLLGCAACSDAPQYTPPSDAPQYTPPTSNGALAGVVTIAPASGSRTIPMTPTHEGDRVYVLLTGTDANVNDIVAGADRVSLLSALSTGPCPGQWAWMWLSRGVAAGNDSITITADRGAPYAGYALVFSGLSPDIALGIGETEQWAYGSAGDASAPPLPVAQGNVMLSTVATCGSAQPVLSSSVFAGMPPINGIDVAYAITQGPQQAGATWSVDGQEWGTYSLVLH